VKVGRHWGAEPWSDNEKVVLEPVPTEPIEEGEEGFPAPRATGNA